MHICAAERFHGDLLAGRHLDDSRRGHGKRAPPHLHHKVGEAGDEARPAERITDDRRGDRDLAPPSCEPGEHRLARVAHCTERIGQARTTGLAKVDERVTGTRGLLIDAFELAGADEGAGGAFDRDVVRNDRDGPTVDGRVPTYLAVARGIGPILGSFGSREHADLGERPGVDERRDVIPRAAAARGVEPRHLVGAAHLFSDRVALDRDRFGLLAHGRVASRSHVLDVTPCWRSSIFFTRIDVSLRGKSSTRSM
ncbi:unannotated protein [freshwater metagenome]|uniref:Unannotated protein n=1 Tax=freshwater metagenome TaxID=449393 RepID=A0A6J7AUP7_9ZZZZ